MFSDWPRSRIKIQDPNAILMINNGGRMNSSFHLVSSAGFRDKISSPINVSGTVSLMFFSKVDIASKATAPLQQPAKTRRAFINSFQAKLVCFISEIRIFEDPF
jgi:hypothetical protein